MTQKIHNLDESVSESFQFIVKGHTYSFRHMNTEEMQELKSLEGDETKVSEYMYSFIDKVDKDAPDFPDVAKKMTVPQWVLFRKMIQSEYSG